MIVDVVLPIPLRTSFSYALPGELGDFARLWQRVRVPLNRRIMTGYITAVREGDREGLKNVEALVDIFPLLSPELIDLVLWASEYYVTPPGVVLKYALPPAMNPERYLVIGAPDGDQGIVHGQSMKKALREKGWLWVARHYRNNALELRDIYTNGLFQPMVRGSGERGNGGRELCIGPFHERLDYYLERVASAVRSGGNVLFLVPDHDTIGRYLFGAMKRAFPHKVWWFTSSAGRGQRMETFFRARTTSGNIIFGNKNCVFLPVFDLRLIVVERYSEDDYKHELEFRFNAVTVASTRARMGRIDCILGGSACDLEAGKMIEEGALSVTETAGVSSLDPVSVTTVAGGRIGGEMVSQVLLGDMKESLEKGERIAVYTPRKGYGLRLRCLDCKKPFLCPHCGAPVVFHKERQEVVCNGCGVRAPFDETCRSCGGTFMAFSHGGADFVAEKVKEVFPSVPVFTVTGEILRAGDRKAMEEGMKTGPAVLVGTKILSRLYGMKADRFYMVGWEQMLHLGGYRATESLGLLVSDCVDALGRPDVVVSVDGTANIDPAGLGDLPRFMAEEVKRREAARFPPFVRVFLIEFNAATVAKGEETAREIRRIFHQVVPSAEIVGPLFDGRQKRKWRMIAKMGRDSDIRGLMELYDIRTVRIEADPVWL